MIGKVGETVQNYCLTCCLHKHLDKTEIFWTKIHLQPDRYAFDRTDAHKSTMILHNFGSGSIFIFIFFPIAAL